MKKAKRKLWRRGQGLATRKLVWSRGIKRSSAPSKDEIILHPKTIIQLDSESHTEQRCLQEPSPRHSRRAAHPHRACSLAVPSESCQLRRRESWRAEELEHLLPFALLEIERMLMLFGASSGSIMILPFVASSWTRYSRTSAEPESATQDPLSDTPSAPKSSLP